MNREDISRLILDVGNGDEEWEIIAKQLHKHFPEELERFAALVASAERERIKQANAPEIERINAHIKESLAQPEQEPVAWMNDSTPSGIFARHMEGAKNFGCTIPLYTTPPQRTWVGLTDEEVINVMPDDDTPMSLGEAFSKFAVAIEAALKAKNT